MVLSGFSNKEQIEQAYNSALRFAGAHYENFPVVSFLVPSHLRKHVAVIYWFARTADDIADEGDIEDFDRITRLNHFQDRLTELINGNAESDMELALASTIKNMNLSTDLFFNLLTAFRQDISKKTYCTFDEILQYCSNSANPVGRLILELFNIRSEEAFIYSDNVCTGLQLANFYQDTSLDFEKGRIYYPADEMQRFNVHQNSFAIKENNPNLQKLVKLNVERAAGMFKEGRKLLKFLPLRLKFEIKWTILGGEEILRKIRLQDYNVLLIRPSLKKKDFFKLLLKSIIWSNRQKI